MTQGKAWCIKTAGFRSLNCTTPLRTRVGEWRAFRVHAHHFWFSSLTLCQTCFSLSTALCFVPLNLEALLFPWSPILCSLNVLAFISVMEVIVKSVISKMHWVDNLLLKALILPWLYDFLAILLLTTCGWETTGQLLQWISISGCLVTVLWCCNRAVAYLSSLPILAVVYRLFYLFYLPTANLPIYHNLPISTNFFADLPNFNFFYRSFCYFM